MRAYIEGVGLLGPGLPGWKESKALLLGQTAYSPERTAIPPSELLPPAERRRAGTTVKLALATGAEAFSASGQDAERTRTVFTSSSAETEILHQTCEALATPAREISPTRFMNSVHNAPAGYWSIATRSREASTSLCAFDASFVAGLLESAVQVAVDESPVALIAYDEPYPEPLHAARPLGCEFAVALVFSPDRTPRSLVAIDVDLVSGEETVLADPALEAIRVGNPAARSLPLLKLLAEGAAGEVVFRYVAGQGLRARVTPCR